MFRDLSQMNLCIQLGRKNSNRILQRWESSRMEITQDEEENMLSIYSNTFWHRGKKNSPSAPITTECNSLFPGHGNNMFQPPSENEIQKENSYGSKGMCSIMPKSLRNSSWIFQVPEQHLDPVSVMKSHGLKYSLALGFGHWVHPATVPPLF